ncbi:MAG: NOP5/NOP56 family protein [Halodesulfurarchaeum sp.]
MSDAGWFEGLRAEDTDRAVRAIRTGSAETPRDWPARAVESGSVEDESAYYEWLHEATLEAARQAVTDRERASDQQLVHAVRAVDDLSETVNELAERAAEWAGSQYGESREGMAYVLEVADREPETPIETEVVELAGSVRDLRARRDRLRAVVEEQAELVAPNLSLLAGPLLAARLIALAGSLEALAKKPSGSLQVLGAEDALFAHLEGHAPSPKHGVIFTHEYVRETRPEKRGSAARALAGKLSIAARIDHYRGELHPDLERELDERIETVRSGGGEP